MRTPSRDNSLGLEPGLLWTFLFVLDNRVLFSDFMFQGRDAFTFFLSLSCTGVLFYAYVADGMFVLTASSFCQLVDF